MRINVWQEEDEWGVVYYMRGNPYMRYVRQDDWGFVFVDPEGLEWVTFSFDDPLLGRMTIECDPSWIDYENALGCSESSGGDCGWSQDAQGVWQPCPHDSAKWELMRHKVEENVTIYIFERTADMD